MSRPRPAVHLFLDRGCPYAHRVRALLDAAEVEPVLHEAPLGERPEGVWRYSATGRIPLLVWGELVLTESRVMLEVLAAQLPWTRAWPTDPVHRARHRHGMAVVDEWIAPATFREVPSSDLPRVLEGLDHLAEAVRETPPEPGILAVHVGPTWLAMCAHGSRAVVEGVRARPSLERWLEAAAALPCVRRTAWDPERLQVEIAQAIAAGRLKAPSAPQAVG